jgi:tRNA(Arg) A34 adenosine deaminase TadA
METRDYMKLALAEAEAAAAREEVPVGAVLVMGEEVLARSGNRILELKDPTAHAEILVMRDAAQKLSNERLMGAQLFVTLEPCAMCAAAMSFARIERLVFAADDPKGGAVVHGPRFFDQPTCHWRPRVARVDGELATQSSEVLKAFFRARRG